MEESGVYAHFDHDDHLLGLTKTQLGDMCVACWKPFYRREDAYSCIRITCGYNKLMHQECAERPRWITHPDHEHKLKLTQRRNLSLERGKCAACHRYIFGLGYHCDDGCAFQLHLRCASYAAKPTDEHGLQHPSHPQHILHQLNRRHSFRCDACGTTENETNISYICAICQYWVHGKCAEAPPAHLDTNDHQHTLSLAYGLPEMYLKSKTRCGKCKNELLPKYWVYHCGSCSFAVHTKCLVFKKSKQSRWRAWRVAMRAIINLDQFTITDTSEDLIKTFVIRESEETVLSHDNMFNNGKCQFHHHPLSLPSAPTDHDQIEEVICDGCTTLIPKKDKKYMSCGECRFFLHFSCFRLPPELSYHPLHQPNHKMILQTCPNDAFVVRCGICRLTTSGLFYACTQCESFKIDIKCASMPNTINHAFHRTRFHNLKMLVADEDLEEQYQGSCRGCGRVDPAFYRCDSCRFVVCFRCVLLPLSIGHRWDDHTLWLRDDHSDANPLYCEVCEEEMDPKLWMYHCHKCDQSFHPNCVSTETGEYRNIKFGQKYLAATTCHDHDHPLSYQLIATKLRCDLCDEYVFGCPGFHCELCNFVMCRDRCGINHIRASK